VTEKVGRAASLPCGCCSGSATRVVRLGTALALHPILLRRTSWAGTDGLASTLRRSLAGSWSIVLVRFRRRRGLRAKGSSDERERRRWFGDRRATELGSRPPLHLEREGPTRSKKRRRKDEGQNERWGLKEEEGSGRTDPTE